MNQKPSLIAVDPGIREIGLAHFVGDELVDYGVKSLRRPNRRPPPLKILARHMERLFAEKKPEAVALEKNSFSQIRQNREIVAAAQFIRCLAGRYKIPLYEFAPNTIRKEVTADGRATKYQIAKIVISRYPELAAYRLARSRTQEKFQLNLFDAVACGLTYLKLYDEQRLFPYLCPTFPKTTLPDQQG